PTRSGSFCTSSPESASAMSLATMPNWTNGSRCLASRGSIQRVGSKSRTSPANRVAKSLVSKCVIGPMPLLPLTAARQVSSRPMPSGVTRPMPVTTTLLMDTPSPDGTKLEPIGEKSSRRVRLDVFDGVLDRLDLLGVLVGDLDPERLFERQHQLH